MTRKRQGVAALELALSLPILMIMLSGIIDFGFFFSQALQATHVTRQAARTASGTDFDDDPAALGYLNLVNSATDSHLPVADATMTVTVDPTNELVTASYEAPYDPPVGLILSSNTLTLRGSMTMRMEDLSP